MSKWNYRLIRHKDKNNADYFAIHEVFYGDEDKPTSVTENGADIGGDSIGEAKEVLDSMQEAFKQPVLDYEDF